jgi:hypothetical protein
MTEKPKTYNADLANLPPALTPLTQEPRWVVWDWELRTNKNGEKWTKPPRQACDPRRNAKSNDPSTWAKYEAAVGAVLAGNAAGIGYMLSGSDIGAGDLDHVRDAESGAIEPWAEELCAEASGAYREVTVSGTGLRVIGKCTGPEMHRKFTFNLKTGAAIELYRNTARFITVSGLELGGPCDGLPPFDGWVDTMYARFSADALDFNNAAPQEPSIDFDAVIRNGVPEGERSEMFQACVWHLASTGDTAEQITDKFSRHPGGIGAKYADRLYAEVGRSYQKWQSRARAGVTGGTATVSTPWPQIRVVPGEHPRVVNEAEDALLLLGREIYQRGELIVRVVKLPEIKASKDRDITGWRLLPVNRPYLVEALCCAGRFLRYDGRTKDWVHINAPDNVAEAYLSRQGNWKLPVLTGITNTPFLRRNGSICSQPGYDPETGLLFKPDGQTFPPVPEQPTKDDANAALAEIDKLIDTFPFVTLADHSVTLSGFLTALDRRAMATAPLHAFTAPVAGTGKSLLVDLISILATGQPMPVIAPGRSEEELEKRLGAAFLAGDVCVSIDNCEHELAGSFLCQALTQMRLNIRILGQSKNVEMPVNATIFATGNNLVIAGDLTRRTLLCSLDAGCEHPEQRSFDDTSIDETVRRKRDRLVAAVLTVLRAWHMADAAPQAKPLGSFEDWSYRVREPLLWLGRADPCDTMIKVKSGDPARAVLTAVMAQWKENFGVGTPWTVQDILTRSFNVTELHTALAVAAGGATGTVTNQRLGKWLKKVEGQIVGGLALRQAGAAHGGYPLWCLTEGMS